MPEEMKAPAAPVKAPLRAFEDWAFAKQLEPWKVRAAKEMHRWPLGQEMSEADFDKAVDAATTHVCR